MLKVKGFNSFAQEQCVDFEKLTANGIFGVFGPTGSGKSSLVDAITMALYGKMPRYDKIRLQCINVDCDSMYICFTFELCANGATNRYTVERSYKRSTRAGSAESMGIEAIHVRLYEQTTDGHRILADTPTTLTVEIKRLIGIGYDDFIRSVILPQGKFSEFLLLTNKPRCDMLERIFGLERYGEALNKQLLGKSREVKNALEIAQSNLNIYGDISDTTLTEAKKAIDSETTELERLRHGLSEREQQMNAANTLLELLREYDTLCKQQAAQRSKAAYIDQKRAFLLKAEQAKRVLPFLLHLREVQRQHTTAQDEQQRNEAAYAQLVAGETEIINALQTFAGYTERELPEIIRKEAELQRVAEIDKQIVTLEKERGGLREAYTTNKQAIDTFKSELEHSVSVLEAERTELENVLLQQQTVSVSAEERRRITELSNLGTRYDDLNKRMQTVLKRIEQALVEQQATEAEYLKLHTQHNANMAATLAEQLEHGKPCPVCGSREHPMPITASSNAVSKKALDAALTKKIAAEEQYKALCTRKDEAEAELGQLRGDIDALWCVSDETNEMSIKNTANVESQNNRSGNILEQINLMFTKMERDAEEYDRHTKKAALLQKQINEHVLASDKKKQQLSETEIAFQKITSEGTELSKTIARLKDERNVITPEADITQIMQTLQTRKLEINNGMNSTKNKYDRFVESKQTLLAKRGLLCAQLNELSESLKIREERLNAILSENNPITVAEVDESIANGTRIDSRIDTAKDEISAYDDQCLLTQNAINNLTDRLGAYSYQLSPPTPEQLKHTELNAASLSADVATLKSTIDQKNALIAVLQERFVQTQKNLEQVKLIKLRINELTKQSDLLTDLSEIFKGNRFVEYLSRKQLKYITAAASARLKEMTSGRYALELDGTDFVIRDDYYGGSRRTPKTLSGGETFMVSLCLALSLSARIQLKNNASLDFFFLDEGFGSLDRGLVDTVTDALYKLRDERLVIGIISHVEELQHRIEAKIVINPNHENGTGSIIETTEDYR